MVSDYRAKLPRSFSEQSSLKNRSMFNPAIFKTSVNDRPKRLMLGQSQDQNLNDRNNR